MSEFKKVETNEDITEIIRLAREIWQEHYVKIIGQEQVDYMLEKFQSQQAIACQLEEGYEYFLIIDNDQKAGYLSIKHTEDDSKLFLSKIYVHSQARGQGLGKAALEFIKALCRQRGISTIWLTVNKNNSHSIAWYLRMGFINAGSVIQDIGQGFVMDDYKMEKTID